MKPALAILVAVLLLAGCGHTPVHDPLVGTWQCDRPWVRLAFGLSDSTTFYATTVVSARGADSVSLERRGNELRVTSSQGGGMGGAVIDYQPSAGRLVLRNAGRAILGRATTITLRRITTDYSDPFGPPGAWVGVARVSGRRSGGWIVVPFRTGGGMVRITGIYAVSPGQDLGYSEEPLVSVDHPNGPEIETVDSDFAANLPKNSDTIDQVSMRALSPGLWRFEISLDARYALCIYLKK